MKSAGKLKSSYAYSNSQKFISKLLIVTMLLLDLPFLGTLNSATAETINPDSWVTIPVKQDPILQGLNIPANAATQGMWSGVYNWPFNGLHMVVLPDGKVLTYGTDLPNGWEQDGRYFDVWDPTLGFGTNSHNTSFKADAVNSFCSTSTYLNNGNVIVSGGNGANASNIYSPSTNTRSTASYNLALERWYATMISLPDGRPLMLGGMRTYSEGMELNPDQAIASGSPSMTPEILETNGWRSLVGATSRDAFGPDVLRTSYPRAWVAPNGLVFGVSSDKMWFLDPAGNGSIPYVGDYKRYGGSTIVNAGSTNTAVMYAPGKILIVGGNGGQNEDGRAASNQATVIDINSGTPVLTEQPNMTGPRRLANSIVLANGQVVVTGGTKRGNNNGSDSVFTTEIWTPTTPNGSTGTWLTGPNAGIYRGYHSQSVLMPNGTILSEGGGSPGPVDNKNAEIYYPPYLFKNVNGTSQLATRPVIKAISGLSYNNNTDMQMDMESENTISQLVLIGISQGTHNFNTGQRRIPLTFSQESFRLTTTIPNANLTPPGYYQVVALDADGVPSLGTIIAIGQNQAPPSVPPNPYTPPDISGAIDAPVINSGGTANYSLTAVSGITYSWNFGDGSPSTQFNTNPSISHTFSQPGLYVVTLSARDTANIITTRTFLQAVATPKTANSPTNSTSIIYETRAGNSSRVWVVNPDNDSVSVLDAVTNTITSTINVGISPRTLAIAPDGRIWVTNKESASISIISPTTLAVVQTIAIPRASQPHGIAFAPGGGSAYVALEATGQLIKLNPNTGSQQGLVNVGNNPRHVAISADATKVLVSRFITPPLPGESTATVNITSASNIGGEVVVVNPNSMSVTETVILHHSDKGDSEIQGSGIPNYLGAASISPDGTTAWIPSKQDNIKRGMLRNARNLDFQNTVRAISSRVDMNTLNEDYAKRIDHDNSSVGSAVVYHPNGVYMFVALETSREVAVLDAISGFELFRLDVGRAPQGLTISPDGNTLYVQEFMDRAVSVFDLTPLTTQGRLVANQIQVIFTVASEKLPAQVVLGKQLFYDAQDTRLARDSYMSCASCHNDAGQDGRVWDLTGFGEGLRNTIALRGRAAMGHGNLHWSANFDELHDFEGQIRTLSGGTGLMTNAQFNTGTRNQPLGDIKAGISADLDNLAAYVASLNTFAQSPNRNTDGTLTAAATAGKAVFTNSCSSCHGGTKFTTSSDGNNLNNIGTINALSGQRLGAALAGIDVPTLRDAWATAPYLHNGSVATVTTAVQAHNNLTLNATDLANVVAFVQQIGSEEITSGNAAPTVALTAPVAGSTITQGATVAITATAADSDGTVARVEFYDGTTLLGTDTTAPYAFSWVTTTSTTTGTRSLTARAFDNIGAATTSAAVSVTVNAPANVAPTVALTAPVAGSTITQGATVAITATAADSDGTVARVEFYDGTTLLGTDTTAPYAFSWVTTTSTTTGTRSLTARAFDNIGAATTSAAVSVTVNTAGSVLSARYIRLTALSEINGNPWATAAEVNILGANGQPLSRTGWTATASSQEVASENGAAANVLDGSASSIWHTAYSSGSTPHPHRLTIDMLTNQVVTGLVYQPRQSWSANGIINSYEIHISNDGVNWGVPVATGLTNLTTRQAITIALNNTNNPSNVAPTVSLTAPTANATFTQGTAITISANAADSDGTVARVEFYDGTTLLGTDTTAPYAFSWVTTTSTTTGTRSLTARAFDNIGAATTSAAVSVTVNAPANVAPTVALTAPVAGSTITQGATVAITATAADSDGTVARVEFYDGTTLLGTDTTAPYAFSWVTTTSTTTGTRSLTARAFDNIGAATTSAAVSVTVNAPANVAPTVALTAPVAGSTITQGATVAITATAADSDGTVARVEFYDGTTLLGTDTTAPYAFSWVTTTSTTTGTRSLTARAFDNIGAATTSAAVSVTVNAPANVAPTVALTSPTANATFTQGTAITISATAADSDGTVAQVQFFDGTTLLGTDTTAPYTMSYTGAALGAHTLTAVATDNTGATTTSAAISVTVDPLPNVAPTVSLTAPTANATFTQGTAITISATAADSDGTVAQVQFFDGTTLLGTDTTAPYTMSYTGAALGAHTLTAVATDNTGATTTSAAISVTVDPLPNVAPTVSLTAPTANATFTQGTAITISATAADSDGTVAQVQFFDGTTLLGTDTTAPYTMSYTGAALGAHTLTAVATDNTGATTTSAAISVTVDPLPNVAPTVSLTAPTANATFTQGTAITISATAADSDGTVAQVQFFDGTTLLGTDTTAPYTMSYTGAALGAHTLTAVATDNTGATTTSAAISVTVDPLPNVAPTVSLTAPTANATFTQGTAITISATAADSDGTVAQVQFFDGTTLLGTDTTAPYTMSYTGAALGAHTLTAVATDNTGATTTSAAISVTVDPLPNVAPTVSLTAPTANATFTQGTAITISATAADSDGTVAQVQFFDGTTLLGTDTTAPYTMSYTGAALGAHTLTAVATDNTGATTTSAAISVTVDPLPNVAPTVSLTAPTANATFTQGTAITISATAADSDGTVAQVQFFDGTTLLGTDTNAPYTMSYTGAALGAHTLTAVATDNTGATTTSAAISVTVDPLPNVAPTVSLTAPTANATFTQGTAITISATAADSDGTVAQVQFFDGTTLLGTDTTAPYTMSYTGAALGAHTLTAVATDNTGATTTSAAISVTVDPLPNVAPTVSLTAPTANATFTQGTAITISATAADSDGTVAQVQFFDGTTLLGTDTTAPYTMSYTGAALGAHTLTAVATDNTGATTTSAAISVTVDPLPNVAPTVSLTAPTANATFTQGTAITISATAADSDGTVAQVQFFDGTTLLGTDTTAPYTMSYTGAALGAHTLTAVATDNTGATTTSAAISVTVDPLPNVAPTVSLTAPTANATFTQGTAITISATAADSDGTVAQVQFFDGTTLLGTDTTVPYTMSYTGAALGAHTLTAVATDNTGATTTSAAISVTVDPLPNVAPTVSLTAPTANATFTQGTAITISATAADSDGTVAQVQFFDGTTLLGTDTTAPYAFSWVTTTSTTTGTRSLTARAFDNIGAATTSAAVSVTVNTAGSVLSARYIRLTALSEINGNPWATAAEVNILGANGQPLSRTGWTATASSQEVASENGAAANVLDGSASSIWHTAYSSGSTPHPHRLTIDMLTNQVVTGLVYQPRQSWSANGIINSYEIHISNDGVNWGVPVATGLTNLTTRQAITIALNNTNNPSNVAPTVSLTAPTANATFTQGTAITISANAADSDGTVARVEFYDGTTLLGTDTTAPYAFSWVTTTSTTTGTRSLTARAFDNIGAATTSAAVSVTVNAPANVAPTVALTAPVAGSTITQGATVAITATAADSDGTVARVEFYDGTTLLGTDTTAPYAFSWVTTTSTTTGTRSLTARAFDNIGAATTSAAVSVTVNAPANVAPTVALTAPVAGSTITQGATVAITATAADSDGTVARVEFYDGTTLLGTDTTAPYAFSWVTTTSTTTGTRSLTARAFDNIGAATTSAAVSVTVNAPANVAPTVALTAPVAGSTITQGATVAITATAADSDGTVARVEFYDGTTLLGTDTTAPYAFSWVTTTSTTTGTRSLTARAFDNIGAATTSAAVSVTVNAPANVAPTVALTAPVAGSTITQGATVAITATAADSDGTVARVEFYDGTTLLGTDTTAPYAFSWVTTTSTTTGTRSLTARAFDNIGAATTSAAVSVTVNTAGSVLSARYIRLTALSEINGNPWATAAEVNILGANGQPLSRTGWTATASSQEVASENGAAANVLDGSASSIWHTAYSSGSTPHPHRLTIDMLTNQVVTGLVYQPRQSWSANGIINSYEIHISNDGVNWGVPVATGLTNLTTRQAITINFMNSN